MNKFLMLMVLAGAVSGCTPFHPDNCHKTMALSDCNSGRFTDQDEYGRQALAIKQAIESQLADQYAWKDKKCRLHLDFAYDGTLKNVASRDGNRAYCAALVSAAQKATFPPFASQHVYEAFASSRFVITGK
ncbi:tolA family protein [Escherichia coli]|nr:tolA family protein [Escherichia coli]